MKTYWISCVFFVLKHFFLVDLFREKKLFFYSSHYCVFIAPNKPLESILFYNFSQWKKKLFSSAFGALFFLPSFITDKFKFCFYWPSWSLQNSLYLTAFIIFVSKVYYLIMKYFFSHSGMHRTIHMRQSAFIFMKLEIRKSLQRWSKDTIMEF